MIQVHPENNVGALKVHALFTTWDIMLDLLLDIPKSLVNGVLSLTTPFASGGSIAVLKSTEESLKKDDSIATH